MLEHMSLKKLIEEITQPIIEDVGGIVASDGTIKGGSRHSKIKKMKNRNDLESTLAVRNVGMMCNKVTMPNRDINTAENRMYGPARRMPYAYSFPGNIEMTFYADKFLRQRAFFENWQNKVFDEDTHYKNYYDNFVGQMDIYQLGSFSAESDRDRITYGLERLAMLIQEEKNIFRKRCRNFCFFCSRFT